MAWFRLGRWGVFLLSHPDDIERVLVREQDVFAKSRGLERMKVLLGEGLLTSEGEAHLRRRRQVQPAFHRKWIERHAEVMVGRTLELEERWRPGERVDVSAEMRALTLEIAGECFFGADLETEVGEIGDALDELLELFPLLVIPFAELLHRLPVRTTLRVREARARLDAVVYRIIDQARERTPGGAAAAAADGDVLSVLLQGTEEGALSREEIRDEVLTLLLAGHETTANWLSWTFHLLSRHPEAEARLQEEVDRVLDDRPPAAEDLPLLEYARRVLSETLRLYPPAWLLGRRALRDWEVRGHRVPEGSMVLMSQWVVHRDARWWPGPERFDPDRWSPEAEGSDARPRFAFFPFGGGRRICIGEGFAWMEAVLVLTTLTRRWRLVESPGAAVRPRAGITLRPWGGVPMVVEPRAGGTGQGG